jgi:hypothetical protein
VNNGCRKDQGVKAVWTLDEMLARPGNEIGVDGAWYI